MGMLFRRKKVGAEYYLERGEECLKNGNYRWALESFTKAIEFDPRLEMAYHGRAEAYRKLGKEREAIWDCIRFLEVDRRTPGTAGDLQEALKEAVNVARMNLQRDKVRSEIVSYGIPKILDEIVEVYDPNLEYNDRRFYDLALSWLEKNLADDGYQIGFVRLLKKEYDEAVKGFDKALSENPESPNLYYLKGVAMMNKLRAEGETSFGRPENVGELRKRACSFFEQALRMGFKGKICPLCGYRTSSTMNYCLRCGEKLLG